MRHLTNLHIAVDDGREPSLVERVMSQIPMILTTMFTLGIIAIIIIVAVPRRYVASADILIDPRGLQVVQNDVTPRSQNNELSIAVVESHLRVVTSEAILRRVVSRLHLDKDPEFAGPGLIGSVLGLVGLDAGNAAPPELRALRKLIKRVDAKRNLRSFVIEVVASSKDPAKAVAIADAVASTYFETEIAARAEIAERAASEISSGLQELGDRVKTAEQEVEAFKAANNLIGTRAQFVSEQQLSELNDRLVMARQRVAEEEARIAQIKRLSSSNADPAAIAEAVNSPVIADLRARYGAVVSGEANLSTVLGSGHPRLIAIRNQAERYRLLIKEELKRLIEAARGEADRATATERALSNELDALKLTATERDQALIKLRELERTAASHRAVYESFLVRSRELDEQRSVDTNNARIIAKAVLPDRPAGPPPILILIGGMLAGIALGTAIAILRTGERYAATTVPVGAHAWPPSGQSAWASPDQAELAPVDQNGWTESDQADWGHPEQAAQLQPGRTR